MNLVQKSKLNAYWVLQGVISGEIELLGSLPEFEMRNAAFDEAVANVRTAEAKQMHVSTTEMQRYKSNRETLLKQCVRLSKKLTFYADSTADKELLTDVRYTTYQLRRMTKSKFLNVASQLIARATALLPQAGAIGLVSQDIDDAADSLAVILHTKDALRNRQLKMRSDSRIISAAIAAADVALERLFVAFDLIADTEPELYQRLLDASRVIFGYKLLSLKGLVADAKTDYPIKGVKLLIRKIGDKAPADLMVETPDVVKVSTGQGAFIMRSLPVGTYLLTASKLGYQTTNIQFNVVPSETTRLSVSMSVA